VLVVELEDEVVDDDDEVDVSIEDRDELVVTEE